MKTDTHRVISGGIHLVCNNTPDEADGVVHNAMDLRGAPQRVGVLNPVTEAVGLCNITPYNITCNITHITHVTYYIHHMRHTSYITHDIHTYINHKQHTTHTIYIIHHIQHIQHTSYTIYNTYIITNNIQQHTHSTLLAPLIRYFLRVVFLT